MMSIPSHGIVLCSSLVLHYEQQSFYHNLFKNSAMIALEHVSQFGCPSYIPAKDTQLNYLRQPLAF